MCRDLSQILPSNCVFDSNMKDNFSALSTTCFQLVLHFLECFLITMAVSYAKATQRLEGFICASFQFSTKDNVSRPDDELCSLCCGWGMWWEWWEEVSSKLSASKVNNTLNFTSAHMLTLRLASDFSYQLLCFSLSGYKVWSHGAAWVCLSSLLLPSNSVAR